MWNRCSYVTWNVVMNDCVFRYILLPGCVCHSSLLYLWEPIRSHSIHSFIIITVFRGCWTRMASSIPEWVYRRHSTRILFNEITLTRDEAREEELWFGWDTMLQLLEWTLHILLHRNWLPQWPYRIYRVQILVHYGQQVGGRYCSVIVPMNEWWSEWGSGPEMESDRFNPNLRCHATVVAEHDRMIDIWRGSRWGLRRLILN